MKLPGFLSLVLLCIPAALVAQPLQLHPSNPHYFLFRGQPTVLITSGEHYGAVINNEFNYVAYLDELQRNRLNLTRLWVGPYREEAGNFSIDHNSLAPRPDVYIAPWPRSATPGAADGGNRFDLRSWNPAFFQRLVDFIAEANKRGIVVEVNLFCPYYEDSMWKVSPLNAANNANGVGAVPRTEILTMKHPELVEIEDAMVRKIVTELNRFENIFYEICNEPYFGGVTLDWQRHIAETIVATEAPLSAKHLISQNIANGSTRIADPDPRVSIFNFHYSRPPESVAMNYALNRAIGNNETGFDGNADATYRIQGWTFLLAGGALYNNLDYTFTVGHERGDFVPATDTPGGGGSAFRKQLSHLRAFFDTIPFVEMAPASDVIAGGLPTGASAYALAKPGAAYAIYISHTREVKDSDPHFRVDSSEHAAELAVNLPAGRYTAEWINPQTGRVEKRLRFHHACGSRTLPSPPYREDIALRILAKR